LPIDQLVQIAVRHGQEIVRGNLANDHGEKIAFIGERSTEFYISSLAVGTTIPEPLHPEPADFARPPWKIAPAIELPLYNGLLGRRFLGRSGKTVLQGV
jgi:hypothetical protein